MFANITVENGHGSAHLKPALSRIPPLASPQPQLQAGSILRSENRISSGLRLMDLNPAQPSFKGEYDEDIFPTSETDPLSVLAYAGRMVDRASDRARQGRATSSKGATTSGSGGLEGSRTSKTGEGEQDRDG